MPFTHSPNTLLPPFFVFFLASTQSAIYCLLQLLSFLVRFQSSYYFDTLIPHWFFFYDFLFLLPFSVVSSHASLPRTIYEFSF